MSDPIQISSPENQNVDGEENAILGLVEMETAELCKYIRKICTYRSGWKYRIDAQVEDPQRGIGNLSLISLNEDNENLTYDIEFEMIERFSSWKLEAAYSTIKIRKYSYDFIKSDKVPTETEFNDAKTKILAELERLRVAKENLKQACDILEPIIKSDNWRPLSRCVDGVRHLPSEVVDQAKNTLIGQYLSVNFDKIFEQDFEKANNVAIDDQHFLLKARAGSGKTTVLGLRTAILREKFGVFHDDMMILAFNRAAAREIGVRIKEQYGISNFDNARTFHSLALAIENPSEGLLFDEGQQIVTQKLSNLIQAIVRDVRCVEFKRSMFQYFRKEAKEMQGVGADLSPDEYRLYRRNLQHVTMRGELVKSKGEKYIADFLFEHDIRYGYEDVEFLKKNEQPSIGRTYRPDFTIYSKDKKYRLEHWGIDEFDRSQSVPDHWTTTWADYRKVMEWKREYWRNRNEVLIETSVADLAQGREKFEKILSRRLEEVGIKPERLPENEIFARIVEFHRAALTRLFVQFIQKSKKRFWNASHVTEMVAKYDFSDERAQAFCVMASRVFSEYEERLKEENLIDFDDLIRRAVEKIHEKNGDIEISVGEANRHKTINLKNLKHLMIDEYQDFSELFFQIVDAMKKYNPDLNIYAVGDDWQAINSFAGSDLKFFTDFSSFFQDGKKGHLLTNYRSKSVIVENGNKLMRGRGKPSVARLENQGGSISLRQVDDTWLSIPKKNDKENWRTNEDLKFFFKSEDGEINYGKIQISRMLKTCFEIISENITKSCFILNRTNRLPGGTALDQFSSQLVSCFSGSRASLVRKNIKVMNIHQSKGQEADVVILLNVVRGVLPLIHPNNSLFTMFGETLVDVINEERRLFYVASTRAREKLFLLTEERYESDFLKSTG